jgi:DNA-binding NtrC family response regulator
MKTILVIDDEISVRESLKVLLKKDYALLFASDGPEGLQRFQESAPDLVLLDLMLPQMNGINVLKKMREIHPETPVIMLTGTRTIKTAVEAIKAGANDYLTKPFDLDELRLSISKELSHRTLEKEVLRLRTEVSQRYGFDNIVGQSQPMREIFAKVTQLADTRTTVLLLGESGVGKELVAKALHYNSARLSQPFVAVNCAAIPEGLLESELFGHERGAFTDAQSRRIGRFESAHHGTLFLDEIADLSLPCQAKILRALQDKKFTRVGGLDTIEADVRLVCATNKNLEEEMRKGRFREDLYYRINVVPISIPPLRKRKEDIPLLVEHFLQKKAREEGHPTKSVSQKAMEALTQYDWPGNIREMQNIVEQMVTLSSKEVIEGDDVPAVIHKKTRREDLEEQALSGKLPLDQAVQEFERRVISQALQKSGHIQTKAANLLGVSRRILKYKMDALGLSEPEPGSEKK